MAGRDAALLLVAEHDDQARFARIDVIRASNRHFERVFDPSRNDTRWDAGGSESMTKVSGMAGRQPVRCSSASRASGGALT
jgi:hypothetical protein